MHFLYQEKFPYFWLMQSLIRFFPEEPQKNIFIKMPSDTDLMNTHYC